MPKLAAPLTDKQLRNAKPKDGPYTFGFLPDHCTLGELQALCESILGRRLGKSSFRRRLDERKLLDPVPGAMRTAAFRPARLYRRSTGATIGAPWPPGRAGESENGRSVTF